MNDHTIKAYADYHDISYLQAKRDIAQMPHHIAVALVPKLAKPAAPGDTK